MCSLLLHGPAADMLCRGAQQEHCAASCCWTSRLVVKTCDAAVRPRLQGLAVKAVRGDALLFYSLKPNGEEDPTSMHGSCPTLKASLHVDTQPACIIVPTQAHRRASSPETFVAVTVVSSTSAN